MSPYNYLRHLLKWETAQNNLKQPTTTYNEQRNNLKQPARSTTSKKQPEMTYNDLQQARKNLKQFESWVENILQKRTNCPIL